MAVVGLVSFLVMARLLSPAEMGKAALGITTLSLLRLLAIPGYAVYLWQMPDDETLEMSIFWSAVVGVCSISGLCVFLILVYGIELGVGEYRGVIQGAACLSIFSALTLVPHALLFRRFKQKQLFKGTLFANFCGAAVGIWGAIEGGGEWSILLKVFVTELVLLIYLIYVTRWFPRFRFNLHQMVECFQFCVSIQANQVLTFAQTRWVDFLLAGFWSPAALGHFYLARRIVEQVSRITLDAVAQVSYPVFAEMRAGLQGSTDFLVQRSYLHTSLFLPLYLIGMLWAEDLIYTVFGQKWTDSIPIFQVLLATKAIYLLIHLCPSFLITHRYEKLRLYLFAVSTVIYMFLLYPTYQNSLVSVAYVQLVATVCYACGLLITLRSIFRINVNEYFRDLFKNVWLIVLVLLGIATASSVLKSELSMGFLVLSTLVLPIHYWTILRSWKPRGIGE